MSVVDEIKERLSIVDVVSEYVNLRRSGRNYVGFCPFHANTRTPSFVVFPETGTWHCFGACGTGGDIFTFIQRKENLDFREALELLAARAGVPLEPRSPSESAEEEANERLRSALSAAAMYYHNLLLRAPEAESARAYVHRRELADKTVQTWQLGYSLNRWDAILQYLTQRGFTIDELAKAGLVVEREQNGHTSYYDRFRGRLMIPIRDHKGRIVAFGARILDISEKKGSDDIEHFRPKYINSPASPIFDKGSVVFGLDQARQAIRAAGEVVIVEGYMDVLMAHQHGVRNVVASMGTALTEAQLRLLRRYTDRLILALDADAAGSQATVRGVYLARQALDREMVPLFTSTGRMRYRSSLAADLRVMTLPTGQDPDDVIRTDPDRWQRLVAAAQPVIDFFISRAATEYDLRTASGKAAAARELAPLIAEVTDEVERAHYVQQVARLLDIDERSILREVAAHDPRRRPLTKPAFTTVSSVGAPSSKDTASPSFHIGVEEHCLVHLLQRPGFLPQLAAELAELGVGKLDSEDFTNSENRALLEALQRWVADNTIWDPESFRETLPSPLRARYDYLREQGNALPPLSAARANRDLIDSVLRLRLERLRQRIVETRYLLEDAQHGQDTERTGTYAQVIRAYSTELRHLWQLLGQRTLLTDTPG